MDTRLLLAAQLRSAADGLAANPGAYEQYNLREQAGTIIAEAYRRGYLHVDGLGPLVERFEGPTPPGPNGAYSNMLLCIVGSHIFHADRVGDSLRTTGVEAGIIDGVLPVDPLRDRDGVVWDGQVVIVLRALADEVEGKPRQTGDTAAAAFEPEARAILFVKDRLKKTGKLPTKTAIAKLLDVDRRTLDNWTAFKVAYSKMKDDLSRRRPPPRGSKSADGNLEAWRV
jgi:hypothetical protein